MRNARASLGNTFRTILCVGAIAGVVTGVVAAVTAERALTYTDARFRIEHRFAPSSDEIVVRFDGEWTDADRAAFAETWGLTPVRPYVEGMRLGAYRTNASPTERRGASDVASGIRGAASRDAGRSTRVHVALVTDRGKTVHAAPGQIIVQFDRSVSDADARTRLAALGCAVLHDFWTPGYYRVGLPATMDVFGAVSRFNDRDDVDFACPDVLGSEDDRLVAPDDPLFPDQWALENTGQFGGTVGADIEYLPAWEMTRGDSLVLIAIVDEGCEVTHPDLEGAFLERPPGHDWSFDNPDSTGGPFNLFGDWHGTSVASLPLAHADNGLGMTGVSPECTGLPLRVSFAASGLASRADAINYSASWKGAFDNVVINLSWKADVDDPGIRTACENAANAGCLTVASAGNGGDPFIEYPAAYSTTVAVGMSTPCDTRAQSDDETCEVVYGAASNFGPELDVVAPGILIQVADISGSFGTDPGDYMIRSGTSFAAPIVTGVAALVWSVAPTLTNAQVLDVLRFSAEDQVGDPAEDTPGFDIYYGYGRVNAYEALITTGAITGTVAGPTRALTEMTKLPDAVLAVDPALGTLYDYRISTDPIDAQDTGEAYVTGEILLNSATRVDTAVVEFGLITRAARDSALVTTGIASRMFDQSVFMRVAVSDSGRVASPGDYSAFITGGAGEAVPVEGAFSFSLRLVPDGPAGGMAYLSIDGGPYGAGHPYGVNNGTALGGSYPPEDLSEAYLLAQLRTPADGEKASVVFRNVRAGTIDPGWGHSLQATVDVFETSETFLADGNGDLSIPIQAYEPRTLIVSAPQCFPDTLHVSVDYEETLPVTFALEQRPRAVISGRVRAVSAAVSLPDSTLSVDPDGGSAYDYVIGDVPFDAQSPDTVYVRGNVTLHDVADLDSTVVEFGLITEAQRDSALVITGTPSDMFDQAVFVRYALTDTGRVAAPGDFDAALPGGVGVGQPASPTFTFDLRLIPAPGGGGTAALAIDGGAYGDPITYGVDNGTALGGSFPVEDLTSSFLVAQLRGVGGAGGSVTFRNVRAEAVRPGYGEGLPARIQTLGALATTLADADGYYSLEVPGLLELTISYERDGFPTEFANVDLAHRDTLYQPMGLIKLPQATLAGRLRSVTGVVTLLNDTLVVDPDGTVHDHRLASVPVDAQAADTVYVSGTVDLFDVSDVDSTVVEFGLVSAAQRDSALIITGDPSDLFDQAVFVRYALSDTGHVAAAGDFDAAIAGALGPALLAPPTFSFDLRLVPSDTTGGMVSLSVNGGPYGAAIAYGTDNGTALGGSFPAEDLTEAYLIAQARSTGGVGGQIGFRNLRVEVVDAADAGPLVGRVIDLNSGLEVMSDADGSYELFISAGTVHQIAYDVAGDIPDTLDVVIATDEMLYQPVGLRALPLGAVAGTITTFGSPTSGIDVRLTSIAVEDTTNTEGAYLLGSVPVATYDVRVAGAGFGPRHVRGVGVLSDSTLTIDLELLAGFDDDFEFGQGAWTHEAGDVDRLDEWHMSGARNATAEGDSSFKCGGFGTGPYSPLNYSILRMPPVVVQPDQYLVFQHFIDAANGLDSEATHGGRVEVSTDDGQSWSILNPVGGYPYSTPADYTGPLGAGTGLFSGSHDFEPVRFALAAFLDDTLHCRFVFAADETLTPGEGWYVDDVRVGDDFIVGVDTSAPTVSARPQLLPNAPNPFNPSTRIGFVVPRTMHVRLSVFDVSGRLVIRLVDETVLAGKRMVVWDGRDRSGDAAASGMYYYELHTEHERLTRSMLLLK